MRPVASDRPVSTNPAAAQTARNVEATAADAAFVPAAPAGTSGRRSDVFVDGAHWIWSVSAATFLLFLATRAALLESFSWQVFALDTLHEWRFVTLWGTYVLAAAMILALTWTDHAWPLILCTFLFFFVALRSPFVAAGFFADGADAAWINSRVPWWSLLALPLVMRALGTRGTRTNAQTRALILLQGIQIGVYAILVLMSIVLLGRAGQIRADWTLPLITLLVAWWIQGRAIAAMGAGAGPRALTRRRLRPSSPASSS